MIIDDLDILGSALGPLEADLVSVIDPNRVLARSISLELLEPQARKGQGSERDRRVPRSSNPRRRRCALFPCRGTRRSREALLHDINALHKE
jgi:hypothetical protein